MQDKDEEIAFFDRHAEADDYNVFTDLASARIIDAVLRRTDLPSGASVADLGCGSGVFTHLLRLRGLNAQGVDISPKLIELARRKHPDIPFHVGDVEELPFERDSLDGLLLSGIVHHFPDPSRFASEAFRVLRRGGTFFAFDPNRRNPFMYLYRDRTSPFYSPIGVTENERPIIAEECARVFERAGFRVRTDFLSGLAYRYVASRGARLVLPIYNFADAMLFRSTLLHRFSAFVLTYGEKE
jgi:SAM-dependent methyltransferase